jgi:hypothetical protein
MTKVLKIYIAGITFEKSTKRSSVENLVNSTSIFLRHINFQVFSRLISFQNENALIEFDFQGHDRIRTRNGYRILSNFFASRIGKISYLIKIYVVSIFSRNRNKLRRGKKYSWKQLNLTGKHVFIWQDFLETDSEFLLVFEDDVLGDLESDRRLAEIIQQISTINDRPIFVNLIHEFDLRSKSIKTDILNLPSYFYNTEVFANTTGAYIVNREMAGYLFEAILTNPNLRVVGADWLIGLLGMKFKDNARSLCLNVLPGVFYNQSLSTNTSSLEN